MIILFNSYMQIAGILSIVKAVSDHTKISAGREECKAGCKQHVQDACGFVYHFDNLA